MESKGFHPPKKEVAMNTDLGTSSISDFKALLWQPSVPRNIGGVCMQNRVHPNLWGTFCYNASSSPVLAIPVVQQVEERSTLDSGVRWGNSRFVPSNPGQKKTQTWWGTQAQCRDNQWLECLDHMQS